MTTQLSSHPSGSASGKPSAVPYGRIWLFGLLAIVAAVIANVVARAILLAIFPITPGFLPFTLPPIIMFTTIGMIGAVIVFALVARTSKQPARTYTWIALAAFVLSCVPDVLIALNPAAAPPVPDAPVGTMLDWLLLIILHAIPAVIAILLLPRALKR